MCLVFALPFGGVGAGAAYAIVGTIRDGMAAREWVRVKAEVLSHGNGSVLYRYTMDGKSYTGDRLGSNVIGGTDNVDSWHEDMESMLTAARSEGKPITVFVNPDDPTQSMVDNTIRWKLLVFFIPFALAFGGVGVGALFMMYKALAGDRPSPSRATKARATPNTVASDQRGGIVMLWVFAFFWNSISFPIAFLFVPEIWASGEWVGLFVLLFPLIGVLLLWGCIAGTINYFRRGGAGLLLKNDSPRAGGTVEGAITFPRGIAAGTPFRVRLVCNRGNVDSRRRAPQPARADAGRTVRGRRAVAARLAHPHPRRGADARSRGMRRVERRAPGPMAPGPRAGRQPLVRGARDAHDE
jgi:hypothetical protein